MSTGCHNCAGCKEPGITPEVRDRWHDSIGEVWDKVRAEQRRYADLREAISDLLEAHQ
jgi:hypothetical protein